MGESAAIAKSAICRDSPTLETMVDACGAERQKIFAPIAAGKGSLLRVLPHKEQPRAYAPSPSKPNFAEVEIDEPLA